MKRMSTVVITAVLLLVLLLAFVVFGRGYSARVPPGRFETLLAPKYGDFAVPSSAKNMKNPIVPTAEVLKQAQQHFADHCASCHANDGSGETEMGRRMYPPAPDMRQKSTQALTDGGLYYIIKNGIRFTGMPASGEEGPHDYESWALVSFIRQLPQLTPSEVKDMEQFNPKSPAEVKEQQEEERFLNGSKR